MENLPTAAKMSRIRRENDKTTRRTRNPAFKTIAALPARIAELDAKHNAPLKAPETSGTPPHRHRRTRSPTIRITARNLAGAATASATCWPSSPTAPSMRRGLPHARDCPVPEGFAPGSPFGPGLVGIAAEHRGRSANGRLVVTMTELRAQRRLIRRDSSWAADWAKGRQPLIAFAIKRRAARDQDA